MLNWKNVYRVVTEGSLPFPHSCVIGEKRVTPLKWTTVPEPITWGGELALKSIVETVSRVIKEHKIERVGVWLSGGLDSSLLTAIAVQLLGEDNVEAFTLGFDGNDETSWADRVTAYLGVLRHYISYFDLDTHYELLRESVANEQMPLAFSTQTLHIAKQCEIAGVPHVFSALGLDELCGGYPVHVNARPSQFRQVEHDALLFANYHYAWKQNAQCKDMSFQLHFPYLEPELIAIFRGFPRSMKVHNAHTKVAIRQELKSKNWLPQDVVDRGRVAGTKGGFVPNLSTLWGQGLRLMTNILSEQGWDLLTRKLGSRIKLKRFITRARRLVSGTENYWFKLRLASVPLLESCFGWWFV